MVLQFYHIRFNWEQQKKNILKQHKNNEKFKKLEKNFTNNNVLKTRMISFKMNIISKEHKKNYHWSKYKKLIKRKIKKISFIINQKIIFN